MTTLHIDFETRSTVDLRRAGVYVYAQNPETNVWCAAYAVDDGEIKLWVPGIFEIEDFDFNEPVLELNNAAAGKLARGVPRDIIRAVVENWTIVAHNASFERVIWKHILTPRYGWPEPKLTQWRCTMAMALALSLPASLENAAAAVGIAARKDMDGHGTMMRMAKPRRARKGEMPNGTYWFDDEERRQKLYAYCRNDVEVERQLEKRLLPLRPDEQRLWWLDQTINDRGVFVDTKLCHAALKIVGQAAAWLDDEMRAVTRGAVSACSNVGQITEWLRVNGCPDVDSIAKGAIDDLLVRQDLSAACRRVLELRREAAKASVAKIDALLAGKNEDGRARGLLQYHAAGPGRWGGRRFQPHNLKRPQLGEDKIDDAIDAVASGDAEMVRMLYGEPLSVVGDCLRGMVKAAPGHKIVAADLSNIEGRVTSWVSGEEWKLNAFRAFDAGTGHDIYHITAGKILKRDLGPVAKPNITKPERQAYGKVPELALGFQGGVVAFQKMAVAYGVRLTDEEADKIKCDWRAAHPATEQTWHALEEAAIRAVIDRGKVVSCGPVSFRSVSSFLFLRMPSGRCIAYPYPKVVDKMTPWGKLKSTVSFKGVDTFTRKWTDCYAYGGLWMQNIAEGISRDVLAEGMVRLEAAGYPIILTVHDEAVGEPPAAHGSAEEFAAIMTETPAWAPGLPIAASGFEAERYRK